jgi:uncharacterized protein (TIGR03067 family)
MLPADPTLSVAERVDAACDRFESEWKGGVRPRIDDYVAAAPESDREELRQALLALELELQGRSEGDSSVTRSSVQADRKPTPMMTADHDQNPALPAKTIGRFELRNVLGSGAFGKVYRAFDPQLGREVALKVPLSSTVESEKERAKFLKEARSAANINHPNVCQIHEVGEAVGRPYIVMALVRGQSLADTLKTRKEPLPEKQAALVVRKIALALAAAHDSGIVHRDLKPANVMFDRERRDIVVMDFGLARGPRLGDVHGTQSGVIMGTPAYMSPEQARGDSKGVGPAGDIFSLGVILYELLTGTRPFTGTATEVLGKILHVEPERPSAVRPGVDPRLETICLKAMAKDTAARFASMKEFAAALDAVLRKSAPTSPTVESVNANATRREGDDGSSNTRNNLAELFAALSDDRKQARVETAAAVEAAIAKHRTPRWVFALAGLFIVGGLTALAGIVFYTKSDKVKVTIELTDVDLSDKSLSFFLDEEPVSAEVLANPIELTPGKHVLVVKRGKEIVKRMLLTVSGGRSPGIKVKDSTPEPPIEPASDDLSRWQGAWRCIDASQGETNYSPEQLKYGGHYQFMSGQARLLQFPASDNRVNRWRGTIQLSANGQFDCDDFRSETGKNTYRQSGQYEFAGDKLRVIYRYGLAGRPLERARWNNRGTDRVIYFEYRKLTPEDDVALWQGRWRCVGEKSRGGAWNSEDLETANKVMEVRGNRLVIERTIDGEFGRYTGTFRLDPIASPRRFDWEGTGPKEGKISFSGVYEFVGPRLRFIYHHGTPKTPGPRAGWADELQGQNVWVEFERILDDASVPLFNNKDLTGWKTHPDQPGGWTVENGYLTGRTTSTVHLFSEGEYGNFYLRAECRINRFGNGGIFFRSPYALVARGRQRFLAPDGYEAQILHEFPEDYANLTGSLLNDGQGVLARIQDCDIKPDQWFTMEVIANDNRLVVRVNGTVTADVENDAHARGHICLQARSDSAARANTRVQFRNIEIKELDDASVSPLQRRVGGLPPENRPAGIGSCDGWLRSCLQDPGVTSEDRGLEDETPTTRRARAAALRSCGGNATFRKMWIAERSVTLT